MCTIRKKKNLLEKTNLSWESNSLSCNNTICHGNCTCAQTMKGSDCLYCSFYFATLGSALICNLATDVCVQVSREKMAPAISGKNRRYLCFIKLMQWYIRRSGYFIQWQIMFMCIIFCSSGPKSECLNYKGLKINPFWIHIDCKLG